MKGKLIKTDVNYILEDDNGVVIASTSLKKGGLSLSLKNCQTIERGYDLDELAKEANGYLYYDSKKENKALAFDDGYRVGFQKALELMGDKKFSEEDMINFSEFVSGKYINQYKFLRDKSLKGFFSTDKILKEYQSLRQTEWDVTVEMEYVGECNGNNDEGCFQDSPGHNCGCFERRPKLDADGCLILKRI